MASVFPDPKFTLVADGKRRKFTYQQLFAYGHRLLKRSNFASASRVFERLATITNRGPRAHILLAICRAAQSDYQGSFRALKEGFPQHPVLVAELQDVVVMSRMGFKSDAIQELAKLVNEYHELPSLCLWLGDMLAAKQRFDKAKDCWELAIARDRAGGAVALSARQQLSSLAGANNRKRKKPAGS